MNALTDQERQGRRLEIRSRAACLSIVLALCCSESRPVRSQPAEGACSADAKPANLNFTFKDLQGKSVTLSDYKGKVVLLDFWATWCPPCRKEIPGFRRVVQHLQVARPGGDRCFDG